jgi:hypothetical protein
MNENLKELELLLAHHDWYYDYSDDYSQYCRGRDQRTAINAEVKRLKDLGLTDEVNELIVKYAPKT